MKMILANIHNKQESLFFVVLILSLLLYPWLSVKSFAFASESNFAKDTVNGQLRVVGSTTIQPIIQSVAQLYADSSGVEVASSGGGSFFGISSVRDKTADMGMVSRELTSEENQEFDHVVIGYDAVAVIVNSVNPKQSITKKELRDIYTCKTKKWSAGLEDHNDILPISKKVGRGTLHVFESYTGLVSPFHQETQPAGQETICSAAWEAGANLDSILWVGGIRGAIGFVSTADARQFIKMGTTIRILEVDGANPLPELVSKDKYPLTRKLHLVFVHENDEAEQFVEYILSEPGQAEVLRQGFVPVNPRCQ